MNRSSFIIHDHDSIGSSNNGTFININYRINSMIYNSTLWFTVGDLHVVIMTYMFLEFGCNITNDKTFEDEYLLETSHRHDDTSCRHVICGVFITQTTTSTKETLLCFRLSRKS